MLLITTQENLFKKINDKRKCIDSKNPKNWVIRKREKNLKNR